MKQFRLQLLHATVLIIILFGIFGVMAGRIIDYTVIAENQKYYNYMIGFILGSTQFVALDFAKEILLRNHMKLFVERLNQKLQELTKTPMPWDKKS